MIHVERAQVPRPSVLDSERAKDERAAAERMFMDPKRDRQQRFPFRIYREPEIRDAVLELFHGKCGYCESRIEAFTARDIELFRPKRSVAERAEHPGYWWLASDWDNILSACQECSRVRTYAGERAGKGSRFPLVDEQRRAFAPGAELGESPLLLDPCRDGPDQHLVFDEHGRVVSDTPRGQASISVLGLNRAPLVEARRATAVAVRALIGDVELLLKAREAGGRAASGTAPILHARADALRLMMEPSQEYAGLKRQLARPTLERLVSLGILDETPAAVAQAPRITRARKAAARTAFVTYEREQSSFSLIDEKGRETYRSEHRRIERVRIRNVKAIREFELDLTKPHAGRNPWVMLLGENGTGKSTILRAIALTLGGANSFARLGALAQVHPRDYIRYRCKTGSVSVKVSGFVGPHRLTFHPDRAEFTGPTGERATVRCDADGPVVSGDGLDPQMILLGYGATRLLPREATGSNRTSAGGSFSRVDNLFNPFVPLNDAEAWLKGLDPIRFDSAALVLKALLRLGADAALILDKDRVLVVEHGAAVPLRQVSDGYQSVVATACDILEVTAQIWPNSVDAEAIVLLDEIGAHLHPSWKMRIVSAMRRAAPGIQFFTSTHDPLCLRGLEAGEVVVLQRGEDHEVHDLQDLPSPGDFRIDQLLTSDFFGLNSTADPETERLFDEYYALLALPDPTDPQAQRIEALKADLKDRRHLGTTMRESLMFEAVDRILAQQKAKPMRPLTAVEEGTADEIARIWAEADSTVGVE